MEAKIPEIVRSSRDSEMLRPPRNESLSNEDDKKTSEMMSFLRNLMDKNTTTPSRNSSGFDSDVQDRRASEEAKKLLEIERMGLIVSNQRYILLEWISKVHKYFRRESLREMCIDETNGLFVPAKMLEQYDRAEDVINSGKGELDYNVILFLVVTLKNISTASQVALSIKEDVTQSIMVTITAILDVTDDKCNSEDLLAFYLYDEKEQSSLLLDYAFAHTVKAFYHLMGHRATSRFFQAIKNKNYGGSKYDRFEQFRPENRGSVGCFSSMLMKKGKRSTSIHIEEKLLNLSPSKNLLFYMIISLFYPILAVFSMFTVFSFGQRCRRFVSSYPFSYVCNWTANLFMLMMLYKLVHSVREFSPIFYCCKSLDDHSTLVDSNGQFNGTNHDIYHWETLKERWQSSKDDFMNHLNPNQDKLCFFRNFNVLQGLLPGQSRPMSNNWVGWEKD